MIKLDLVWAGVTEEQYRSVNERLDLENDPADGLQIHLAGFDGTLRITEVWDSEQQANNFAQNRLGPIFADLGFTTKPEIVISPLIENLDESGYNFFYS